MSVVFVSPVEGTTIPCGTDGGGGAVDGGSGGGGGTVDDWSVAQAEVDDATVTPDTSGSPLLIGALSVVHCCMLLLLLQKFSSGAGGRGRVGAQEEGEEMLPSVSTGRGGAGDDGNGGGTSVVVCCVCGCGCVGSKEEGDDEGNATAAAATVTATEGAIENSAETAGGGSVAS